MRLTESPKLYVKNRQKLDFDLPAEKEFLIGRAKQ